MPAFKSAILAKPPMSFNQKRQKHHGRNDSLLVWSFPRCTTGSSGDYCSGENLITHVTMACSSTGLIPIAAEAKMAAKWQTANDKPSYLPELLSPCYYPLDFAFLPPHWKIPAIRVQHNWKLEEVHRSDWQGVRICPFSTFSLNAPQLFLHLLVFSMLYASIFHGRYKMECSLYDYGLASDMPDTLLSSTWTNSRMICWLQWYIELAPE